MMGWGKSDPPPHIGGFLKVEGLWPEVQPDAPSWAADPSLENFRGEASKVSGKDAKSGKRHFSVFGSEFWMKRPGWIWAFAFFLEF